MKNCNELSSIFFSSSDLNNLSFYLYCPSFGPEKKEEITNIINNNNGVSKNNK